MVLAWVELGAPRPRVPTIAAAAIALGLVVVFPYVRFIGEPAKSDTLGLVPLWTINDHLVAGSYWATVALAGVALLARSSCSSPRGTPSPCRSSSSRSSPSCPGRSGRARRRASCRRGIGALRQGNPGVARDWIDRAVPRADEVAVLWTGRADRFTVNMNEFFNRRVGQVYYTDQPTPGGFGEIPRDANRRGTRARHRRPGGKVVEVPYALLDGSVIPDGGVVERNETVGTALWRLTGPPRSRAEITGLYQDTWSGRVRWRRCGAKGGRLTATVHGDPSLFDAASAPSRVEPRDGGGIDAIACVPPTGQRVALPIRVAPSAGRAASTTP